MWHEGVGVTASGSAVVADGCGMKRFAELEGGCITSSVRTDGKHLFSTHGTKNQLLNIL